MDKLKSYFNPNADTSKSLRMVFDGQNSSTVAYVLSTLGYKDKVSPNVYAMHSVDEVIDYIEKNDMAIGFVPFSFVSDTDDDRVKKALKRIKILSLRTIDKEGEEIEVSANQSDIALGAYPLIRQINVVSRFSYSDNLQWLFMNFLYKERGARIFLKDGLIPARMPPREINVNMDGYKGAN
jgi:phosphate transport system substrate-binding protein